MPGTKYLMGVGMPAQQAKRLGLDPTTLAGAGNSQATAASIGQFQFYIRGNAAATSTYGFIMTSIAEVGSDYNFVCISSTTAVIWPPVGGQFNLNAGATATGVSVAQFKGAFLLAVTASTFDVLLSA